MAKRTVSGEKGQIRLRRRNLGGVEHEHAIGLRDRAYVVGIRDEQGSIGVSQPTWAAQYLRPGSSVRIGKGKLPDGGARSLAVAKLLSLNKERANKHKENRFVLTQSKTPEKAQYNSGWDVGCARPVAPLVAGCSRRGCGETVSLRVRSHFRGWVCPDCIMASTVWRGFITFGLISIPVRLFRAARPERVSFRRLYRQEPVDGGDRGRQAIATQDETAVQKLTASARREEPERGVTPIRGAGPAVVPEPILAPVQQASVRKGTAEVVPERSVVKGYEYEKDQFVVVDPEELKSIAPKTATEMEIQEFVQARRDRSRLLRDVLLRPARRSGRKSVCAALQGAADDGTRCDRQICDARAGARRGAASG